VPLLVATAAKAVADARPPAPPPPVETRPGPGPVAGRGFNLEHFNVAFQQSRVRDANDRGYAAWMARLSPEQAAEVQAVDVEKQRRRAARAPSEPEPMTSCKTSYSELSQARVDDFGRAHDCAAAERHALQFSDYKVAHMIANNLVDPGAVASRQEFRDVEDLERARAAPVAPEAVQQEAARVARRAARAEARERERILAVARHDELAKVRHDAAAAALAKEHARLALRQRFEVAPPQTPLPLPPPPVQAGR
jgi:hypothetical protein